jgi:hypothetical protein
MPVQKVAVRTLPFLLMAHQSFRAAIRGDPRTVYANEMLVVVCCSRTNPAISRQRVFPDGAIFQLRRLKKSCLSEKSASWSLPEGLPNPFARSPPCVIHAFLALLVCALPLTATGNGHRTTIGGHQRLSESISEIAHQSWISCGLTRHESYFAIWTHKLGQVAQASQHKVAIRDWFHGTIVAELIMREDLVDGRAMACELKEDNSVAWIEKASSVHRIDGILQWARAAWVDEDCVIGGWTKYTADDRL